MRMEMPTNENILKNKFSHNAKKQYLYVHSAFALYQQWIKHNEYGKFHVSRDTAGSVIRNVQEIWYRSFTEVIKVITTVVVEFLLWNDIWYAFQ